jgi:hypothetical protein
MHYIFQVHDVRVSQLLQETDFADGSRRYSLVGALKPDLF